MTKTHQVPGLPLLPFTTLWSRYHGSPRVTIAGSLFLFYVAGTDLAISKSKNILERREVVVENLVEEKNYLSSKLNTPLK